MDKEKLKKFLRELTELENKHGIFVTAGTSEVIDYDWNEDPYVFGCDAHLVFSDKDGNEMTMDNLNIDDLSDL